MHPVVALILLLMLLAGPLLSAPVEHNIEFFFLALGIFSALLSHHLTVNLIEHAASEPIPITIAVVVAGALFGLVRSRLGRGLTGLMRLMPRALVAGGMLLVIALASSLITAIVAALMLAEVIQLLELPTQARVPVTVAGCFAIGLGAALTPVGEPLATIAVDALGLGFFGLLHLLGYLVLPAIVLCSVLGGFFARHGGGIAPEPASDRKAEFLRSGVRIYCFVAGLVLLSAAFALVAGRYVAQLPPAALYWGNMISAAADNATLVAIEMRGLTPHQAQPALMALLISGGMMIPGNVPNIICANRLRIGSKAWAKAGLPLGLGLMAVYYLVLLAA